MNKTNARFYSLKYAIVSMKLLTKAFIEYLIQMDLHLYLNAIHIQYACTFQ